MSAFVTHIVVKVTPAAIVFGGAWLIGRLLRNRIKQAVRELKTLYPSPTQYKDICQEVRRRTIAGRYTEAERNAILKIIQEDVGLAIIDQVNAFQDAEEHEEEIAPAAEPDHPRPRVRRGRRWTAAYQIYLRCVVELGKKPYSGPMADTVSIVARRHMKDMHVRDDDYPHLLPLITTLYFTPTSEDIMAAAVMRSSAHRDLRKLVEVPQ